MDSVETPELVENINNDIVTYAANETVDTDFPVIIVKQKKYQIKTGEEFKIEGVVASDPTDGDLTSNLKSNFDTIDFNTPGIKKVEYFVSDNAGNTSYETVYVTVKKDNTSIIRIGQIGIILVILLILLLLNRYLRSVMIEKRFSKYTLNSSKNKYTSLFDNFYNQYVDFVNKISKKLKKIDFFRRMSKKYNKYESAFKLNSMDLISKKIIVGFLYIVFAIIVGLLESKLIGILEMTASFILGFYTLDVVYFYTYSKYKKKLSDDMVDAISLMNNAFKAGMSITQSIDLVSREVKGPIGNEFKKVSNDIRMGLDIEVAFKRFSKRVNTKEAIYLASSLSVLSKTGGNINRVFSSIEKNMLNRKKLNNELKALTSSSKLILYVLMLVPPLFAFIIGFINKDYFKPLFSNVLGIFIIFIMLMIYIMYIIVIKKVLKVKYIG